MSEILVKHWLTRGWRPLEAEKEGKPMAMAFIEQLNRHNVPFGAYRELYNRAIDLRARRLENGLKCEDFSVDLMLACWPAVRTEIREREIEAKRFLPTTAESDCPRCFGTGAEIVYDDETGEKLGTRFGGMCEHRPLEPGEWLYKEQEKLNNEVNNA